LVGTDDDRAEAMIAGLDEVLGGAAPAAVDELPAAPDLEVPEPAASPAALSSDYADSPVSEHYATPAETLGAEIVSSGGVEPALAASGQEAAAPPAPFGGVETFAEPAAAPAAEESEALTQDYVQQVAAGQATRRRAASRSCAGSRNCARCWA